MFIRHRHAEDASATSVAMRKERRSYVYMMTNRPRSHVLCTGITGDLWRRVFEHKNKLVPGFTSRYNLTRLVYYESFVYPDAAIRREKEIKGWLRIKKIRLIESMNPHWDDLAESWWDVYKPSEVAVARRRAIQDDSGG
jgi:putative endonuclease